MRTDFAQPGQVGIRAQARPWLVVALLALVAAFALFFGVIAYGSRVAVREEAGTTLRNIKTAITQEISHNVDILDAALRGIAEDINQPDLMSATPTFRQRMLFDKAAAAEYLERMFVLDRQGRVTLDFRTLSPPPVSHGERDYFKVHVADRGVGLYVSTPLISPATGARIIAFSRRLETPDGTFLGVAVATLRLEYFRMLFSRMRIQAGSSMTLVRGDGTVIMRTPYDESLIGSVIPMGGLLLSLADAPDGEMQAVSSIDHVERIISYRQIRRLPLIQAVTASVSDVYKGWTRLTILGGVIMGSLCSMVVVLVVRLQRELRQKERAQRALQQLSEVDPLTGIANRRRFDMALSDEWNRARRQGAAVALLMIDADQFKLFNDSLGHLVGDYALQALAQCLAFHARRPGDLAARYGGEEFAVILPQIDTQGALLVAEAIRRDVAAMAIVHPRSRTGHFTVSIGVGILHPTLGEDASGLIAVADEALYRAKADGRDRVRVNAGRRHASAIAVA